MNKRIKDINKTTTNADDKYFMVDSEFSGVEKLNGDDLKSDFKSSFDDIYLDKETGGTVSGDVTFDGNVVVNSNVEMNGNKITGNGDGVADSDLATVGQMNTELSGKVDVVVGKELSTNDYTDLEKAKLVTVEANANNYELPSDVVVDADLDSYSTTTETASLLNTKVDKITGKVLSENDFTDTDKTKVTNAVQTDGSTPFTATQKGVDGVEENDFATVGQTSEINFTSEKNQLLNNISNNLKLDENYDIKNVKIFTYQLNSTLNDSTKTRNNTEINGQDLVTDLTGSPEHNIFDIILNGSSDVLPIDTVITLVFNVYSNKAMSNISPSTWFTDASTVITDHNFDYLDIGWNTKYIKVQVLDEAENANAYRIVFFNKLVADNEVQFDGSTLFFGGIYYSYDLLTMTDINTVDILTRVNTAETWLDITNKNYINCWGDSITQGAGVDNTRNQNYVLAKFAEFGIDTTELLYPAYPQTIDVILDDKYTVINNGVAGEKIDTIGSRQGAFPVVLNQEITLSQTAGSTVLIGNDSDNTLKSMYDGNDIKPIIYGAGNSGYSVNPCSISGIPVTLSYTSNNYYITRLDDGDRDVTFRANTPLFFSGSERWRGARAMVLFCWQNGGYSSDADLINKLDKMIDASGTNNYIIVGLHTGDATSQATQESELSKKYTNRFFNWRDYVSSNALLDFGIPISTDADFTTDQLNNGVKSDETQISAGALPSSLWTSVYGQDGDTINDIIHMNAAGYMILGYKVWERMTQLGFIE